MTQRTKAACGLIALLALAACSGSGTSPVTPTQGNIGSNVLQVAVGTANVFGDSPSAAKVGINVAVTYRQPKGSFHAGDSGTAVNTPTIKGPFTLPNVAGSAPGSDLSTIATGPAPSEVDGSVIGATPQSGTTESTFGTSGGAFGLGLEAFNFNNVNGVPWTYTPYAVPVYDNSSGGDPNAFIPWGAPPAFPSTAGGPGIPGISEGLDVFEGVTPVDGAYSLGLSIVGNNGTVTQSSSATMSSTALLPAFKQQNPSLDSNNDGGATFPITLPGGVTEAFVQITDIGPNSPSSVSCNGSSPGTPTLYTLEVSASGPATLAPTLGAGGSPSICTVALNTTANKGVATPGDVFGVSLIGFDYPWFEASYPNSNGNPSPAIAGGNGQADITISSLIEYQQVPGGGGALSVQHRTAHAGFLQPSRRNR